MRVDDGVLKLDNVAFYYDRGIVFDGLNVDFKPNKIYGIIGKNDADKSLLLKCMANIYEVSKGLITYKNESIVNNLDYIGKVFLMDDNYYFSGFNLRLLIKYLASNHELVLDEATYHHLIDVFDFDISKPFFSLSRGQVRIAYFIILFSLKYPVVFIDEFLDGIDMIYKKEIKSLLRDYIKQDHVIVVLSSNSVKDINDLCDEVLLLQEGTFKKQMSIKQLNQLYVKYQLVMDEKMNEDDFALLGLKVYSFESFKNIYTISIANTKDQVDKVLAIDALSLKQVPITHDEVIINELCD